MVNTTEFMSQRPGLPGPQMDPFRQMLQDAFGRMDKFQQQFPRSGSSGQVSQAPPPRFSMPGQGAGIFSRQDGRAY